MAKKPGITKATILSPTKTTPIWQIGILFPDGRKVSKPKCTLNDLFETYFIGLDKYLNMDYTAEQLLELYQKTYQNKEIKVQINYIDSWGHMWKGKVAWPSKDCFIDFLDKRLNDN